MPTHHPTDEPVCIREWSPDTGIYLPVVDAVAAARDDPPTVLEPLYRVIDPDALDQLFRFPNRSAPVAGSVRFPYLEFVVVVEAHGRIYVYEGDGSTVDVDVAT